jgi:hypothetical protein
MNWNIYFDPRLYMSEVEYAILEWEGRVFLTQGWLSGPQAEMEFMAKQDERMSDGFYYGYIITEKPRCLREAQMLAHERGFSERILGFMKINYDQVHIKIHYN